MDIIIFGGQSNMQGQTESSPLENEPVAKAKEYRFATDSLVELRHPVGEDLFYDLLLGSHLQRGSLVPAFCRAYTEETGREVTAVHVARGATTVTEWLEGTSRLYHAKQKIRAAIKKVRESYTVDHVYYVWLQGESDALIQSSEELYLKRLVELKESLKKDVGIEKFGIIKVGYFAESAGWVAGEKDEKSAWDETIMRAQERAVAEDSDFVMLTRVCTTLSRNEKYINPEASGHYNNEAMEIIGREAGKTLAALK